MQVFLLRLSVTPMCFLACRMRQLYEWGHDRFPDLLDCRPIFVRAALEAAGFQILDSVQKLIFGLPVVIVLASRVD